MSSLKLVPDGQAGPTALGILLPPGERTLLVVRPRAMRWDLLLVQGVSGMAFRVLSRGEAPAVARSFVDSLGRWGCGTPGHVGAVPYGGGTGWLVRADVGDFCLVACERLAGQPYRPSRFEREEDAVLVARHFAAILHPSPGTEQEVYFNTRHFSSHGSGG
jgi:hypothetical protein